MGANDQHYSLRWNDYTVKIVTAFQSLRDEEDFVDVTVACDGHHYSAHKMVLSACSPYFRSVLRANPCQHPIIILKDVGHVEMERLLEFMYNGEVNIAQDQLAAFLKTAENLKIRGLAGSSDDTDQYQTKDGSTHCLNSIPSRSSPNGSIIPIFPLSAECKEVDISNDEVFTSTSPTAKKRKKDGIVDQNSDSLTSEDLLDVRVDPNGQNVSLHDECEREMKPEPTDGLTEVYIDHQDGNSNSGHQDGMDNRPLTYTLGLPGPSGSLGTMIDQSNSGVHGGADCEALNLSLRSSIGSFSSMNGGGHVHQSDISRKNLSTIYQTPVSKSFMVGGNCGYNEKFEPIENGSFNDMTDNQCYPEENLDTMSCEDNKLLITHHLQMQTHSQTMSESSLMLPSHTDGSEYKSKIYPCPECHKVFRHPMSLHHHRHVHKGTYTCHSCGKVFSRRWDLHRHIHRSKMGCKRSTNGSLHPNIQCHPLTNDVQCVIPSSASIQGLSSSSYIMNNPPSN